MPYLTVAGFLNEKSDVHIIEPVHVDFLGLVATWTLNMLSHLKKNMKIMHVLHYR